MKLVKASYNLSYCAAPVVFRFINHHCGVACKANFPVSDVRGDG